MATEVCEAEGIKFLFAFPNQNSFPGFVRNLDYTHLGNMVEYRLPIRAFWLERIALRFGVLHRLYERHVQRTLSPYYPVNPCPENSLISEGHAGTHRDHSFYDYKSFAGNRVIEVEGNRVWLKILRWIMIGDLEATRESEMEKTLETIERLAVRLGIHQVLFQSSEDTRLSRFFAQRFHDLPPSAIVYKNLRSEIPAEKLRFTFGDLDNF